MHALKRIFLPMMNARKRAMLRKLSAKKVELLGSGIAFNYCCCKCLCVF